MSIHLSVRLLREVRALQLSVVIFYALSVLLFERVEDGELVREEAVEGADGGVGLGGDRMSSCRVIPHVPKHLSRRLKNLLDPFLAALLLRFTTQ